MFSVLSRALCRAAHRAPNRHSPHAIRSGQTGRRGRSRQLLGLGHGLGELLVTAAVPSPSASASASATAVLVVTDLPVLAQATPMRVLCAA